MYADKVGNTWAVICQTCTRVFIFSTFMHKSGTRDCPHCSDYTYHHDPAIRANTVLANNKSEQEPDPVEPGDQTLGEVAKPTGTAVSMNGDTRTAAKFQGWRSSGYLRENCELECRYQYSDECFIDVDFGKHYRIILGNGEYEFFSKTEAEIFLWNNFSRHHFEAGEVS